MRLTETTVKLPFLNVETKWSLNTAERDAAWQLLVELVTRMGGPQLADEQGCDREVLVQLASLAEAVRQILVSQGIGTAPSTGDGNIPFATVAVRMLNEVVQPLVNRWQPLLDAHHAKRPADQAMAEWERARWGGPGAPYHVAFRRDLFRVRNNLRDYVFVLARASNTVEFGAAIEGDGRREAFATGAVRWTGTEDEDLAVEWDGSRPDPRQHMVRWFDPAVLARAGWLQHRATQRSAGRESMQAAKPRLYGNDGEVWFDYVADLGDAFDPTMQVAWTLGRANLELQPTATPLDWRDLPRGDLLVMGGDEVYPYASERRYKDQLLLPYSLALQPSASTPSHPATPSASPVPDVYAIPGNHDWMGGIGPWKDVFCRGKKVGGWQSRQEASWWAAQLPHGWWLWGIDTAMDGKINPNQEEYFAGLAVQPGDQVILCTPVPLWRLRETEPGQLAEIDGFVARTVGAKKAVARVFLSGDSHVFAAYRRRRTSGKEEIHLTSGGGGAFLQPTHNLTPIVPATELGDPDEALIDPAPFVDGFVWPPPANTYRRHLRTIGRATWDRQSPLLALVIAVLHLGYAALMGIGIRNAKPTGSLDAGRRVFKSMVLRMPWWLVTAAVVAGVIAVCALGLAKANTKERDVKRAARRIGFWHGLTQAIWLVGLTGAAYWVVWCWRKGWTLPWTVGLVLVVGMAGSAGSVILIAWYLMAANRRYRVNDNEAFSARHFADGKHFLRCHIDRRGRLEVYLIGIDKVARGWNVKTSADRKKIQLDSPLPAGGARAIAWVEWSSVIPPFVQPVRFPSLGASRRVAVSISDPDHATPEQQARLEELFLLLVERLLAAGFDVAYGGDHRQGGYVERLGDAGRAVSGVPGRLVNYLTATELGRTTSFVPGISVEVVSVKEELGDTREIRFARELSAMRRRMSDECIGRIVIGGRLPAARGVAPGIVEEAWCSLRPLPDGHLINDRWPDGLLVVGGFGGAAGAIARALQVGEDIDVNGALVALAADEGYARRRAATGAPAADAMLRAFTEPSIRQAAEQCKDVKELLTETNPHRIVQVVLDHFRTLVEATRRAS